MRFRLVGTIFLAFAFPFGCATTETRSYRLDSTAPTLETWNGKPLTQVLDVWGAPSERENDGEGGTILIYREALPVTVSSSTGNLNPPDSAPDTPGSTATTKTERLSKIRARFWVNAAGSVYRYWFSSDVYENGEGTLPAPKKPAKASGDH